MTTTFFVTGTDTDCGKTLVTTALLRLGAQQGLETLGLKPVAAGCEPVGKGFQNADAQLIQQAMSAPLEYKQINPFALVPAIAPHIASEEAGLRITVDDVIQRLRPGLAYPADVTLIEGAGGWLVPLNDTEFLSDVAVRLNLPVILVVGMKLGCLNHALLTQAQIQGAGLRIAGWVANQVDPDMARQAENLSTLKRLMTGAFLGHVAHVRGDNDADRSLEAVQYLALPHL